MSYLKRIICLALFILSVPFAHAQMNATDDRPALSEFHKNNVKLNLLALPFRSFSFQYERALKPRMSVALGFRFQPRGGIPLSGFAQNFVSAEDSIANQVLNEASTNAKFSSWAVTPEIRFYLGKKPLNGFYIAPYLRIQSFGLDYNYTFDLDTVSVPAAFEGRLTSFTGGFLLGVQKHIGKHFLLDIWLLGPAVGTAKLNITAKGNFAGLTPEEIGEVKLDIQNLPLYNGASADIKVQNNQVDASARSIFGGLRTGICIGYTF